MAVAGNARAKFEDLSEPPWYRWREKDPAERCIRFCETYCRSPKGAGHGKPIKLAEFQKAWIRKILKPGIREAALQAPRGSGKSTLLAAMALWATFDKNETGQPIVRICATTVQQAIDSVYGVACLMVDAEPELSRRSLVRTAASNARIDVGYSHAECKPIANDFRTLQGLDYTMFILDEVADQSYSVWNAASMASGKRTWSLMVGIGTPTPNKDDSALWEIREQSRAGTLPASCSFTELSAPDDCDIYDEANWLIANPAITEGYLGIDALRNDVATKPESFFRIYRLAQWAEGVDCWLGVDGGKVWRNLKSDYQFKPGADTWAGVDIGLARDCTAVVIGQWNGDVFHTSAKIWNPRKAGAIDRTAIMQYLRELNREYNLIEVSFDKHLFEQQAVDLADEGLPMVDIPQSPERMIPAAGLLYEAIMRGEVSHDGAADFERHVLNAMPQWSDKGFRLTKSRSRGHIDAAIALVLCHDRAQHPVKPLPKLVCL